VVGLHITAESEGRGVAFHRVTDVPDELWNALGRNIAPGVRANSEILVVPVECFLASRNWLGQALVTHGCAVTFDHEVQRLLGRADTERVEVAALLGGSGPDPLSQQSVASLLLGSRFHRDLRPFQFRDLAWLLTLSHGANFSVPGAGKTTVAYACYEAERRRGRVDRLLVVAPLSAFDTWITEAQACFGPPPMVERLFDRIPRRTEVLLVNYQRLAGHYDDVAHWIASGSSHVILDEAHRMKRGRAGEWGRTCLDLAHLAARRDILTGTPAPQHPNDFIALLDFLWPHQAVRILPDSARRPDPPPAVMRDVSTRLRPLFVRTKKDELGLDAPIRRVELVEMSPLQAEIYEALRTRMRHIAASSPRERSMFGQMGEVVMYLVEAATNPALLARAVAGIQPSRMSWPSIAIPAESTLAERVLNYGAYEVPRKFEKLTAIIADNASRGRKTLVWSNFVSNLTELADNVLAPYRPAVIHGAIPSTAEEQDYLTRESELQRFRTDDRCLVLLANPAAMSEGVSLHHACHDAIYLERTFNAGQYLQSIDRIHRLGLSPGTETHLTFLLATGTIDEAIDDRIMIKAQRLSQMLSDPNLVTMTLPDDESYGEWVDPDDLDALFAHLNGPHVS
jgi:SNF2 family DNA or RNA helicase